MAQSLYARTAARGFPAFNASGQTGTGALPDSTRRGTSQAGEPSGSWTDPNVDPGSVVTGVGPPDDYIDSGMLWGLPGGANPDDTPRTHAAPFADPTAPIGTYFAEADAAHGNMFNGMEVRNDVGLQPQYALDHVTGVNGSGSNQQPLTGQIRALGGYDAVQGYGGGADGPGGVNASMPLLADDRNYPGSLYDAPGFISAHEVPFLSAEVSQFIVSEPAYPVFTGGGFEGPTYNVAAQDVVTADTPAQGPPVAVAASAPAYANSFWS